MASGQEGCHIDIAAAGIKGVEEFGEGLRIPRQAVDHDDAGMSSTPAITSTSTSWSSARHGANPTPQLPITAVVTPWAEDGVIRSDQMAWPS